MEAEFVTPDVHPGIVHVASICQLVDGTLAAVWYAGSREAAQDVTIQLAHRRPGDDASWTESRVLVSRESASRDLGRFIKTIGNPILFVDSVNQLWLVYATVSIGRWSGSSLNVTISRDGGHTWTPSRRLTLSPFFNAGELARNRPIALEQGGFAIPIYHELFGGFPELLWLRAEAGELDLRWRKSRMAAGWAFTQPAVVPINADTAVALYRSRSRSRRVALAVTTDAGATWSTPRELGLPNPDAAIAGLLLSDERILLAFNDSQTDRENLRLAVSADMGASWVRIATIDSAPAEAFAYPYLLRSHDQRIHLVYTWRGRRIRHVVFNDEWIDARLKEPLA